MISHRFKCIFVHIPRTGGTSIERLLFKEEKQAGILWDGFDENYNNKYQTGGLQNLLAKHL